MADKTEIQDFTWEGVNPKGEKVRGELSAINITEARNILRKQSIKPGRIRKKSGSLFARAGRKKIKPVDIAFFIRQMATMIKAGIPLVQSFEIVSGSASNVTMRDMILKVRDEVSTGTDFATALRAYPKYFDTLTCNLIEAGENAGTLDKMLDKIAIYKEKVEAVKTKVKKAMLYPAITMVVAIVVTAILLIKVVPTFEELFSSFGADLPAPTQVVVSISEFVQAYYLVTLVALIVAGFLFMYQYQRSYALQDKVDLWLLSVPVIGSIMHNSAVARFCRVMSTTFAAGVPLVDALNSGAGAVGNAKYRDAVMQIKNEVSTGQQMNFAMRNTQVFPNMVIQMTGIGEESGDLDSMLERCAEYYEDEVDNAVDNMTSMIEPAIMVFLGVVIGGLIIAMYLPIFKMGDVI